MNDISTNQPSGEARLTDISFQLKQGREVEPIPVSELMGWFGKKRRRFTVEPRINEALEAAGLITRPTWSNTHISSLIYFLLKSDLAKPNYDVNNQSESVEFLSALQQIPNRPVLNDPTYRIGTLASASTPPQSVSPNDTVTKAITIMLKNDYSQLPVIVGERSVKGMISWKSIGSRLVMGSECKEVRECMDQTRIISSEISLFDAIGEIVKYECVLVQDTTSNKISGIVTTSDLSTEFRKLSEPFLLLGEIEKHIRSLIGRGSFSSDELSGACDAKDESRVINDVADLNFGEYIWLLAKPESWERLNLSIDRKLFIEMLDKTRDIRNDVMHFDPDYGDDDPEYHRDLEHLRNVVGLLQRLQMILP